MVWAASGGAENRVAGFQGLFRNGWHDRRGRDDGRHVPHSGGSTIVNPLNHPRIVAATLAAGAAAAAGGLAFAPSGAARAATQRPAPRIDRREFVRTITNPWLPYRPGSVWVYSGVKDGQTQRDVVTVTRRMKVISGVRCEVLTDIATHGSTVLERTTDWYAQDRAGNVWYFGDRTAAYSNGHVDRSGSWLAGVHGARPGIVMTAHPAVGDAHRQEYQKGVAEDQYWLVDLRQHVKVPFGTFSHAALTLEWSRLEPFVIDRKNYVRGIGVVREMAAEGPPETANLVSFTRTR
jgi:hypothetical protein